LSQVLASEQLQPGWTNLKAAERGESARFSDGIPFAKGSRHTHGSAAVIGRESGSAQVSWDDACTAIVPTWPGWNRSPKSSTDPAQVATLKINPKESKHMFKNFLMDETGAELAEYAVAVALLVAIGLVVYATLGNGINDANSQTGEDIKNASFTAN
jgi:Flp pilus assembly pilin Flp